MTEKILKKIKRDLGYLPSWETGESAVDIVNESMDRSRLQGGGEGGQFERRRICPIPIEENKENEGVNPFDFYRRGLNLLCPESLDGHEGDRENYLGIRGGEGDRNLDENAGRQGECYVPEDDDSKQDSME